MKIDRTSVKALSAAIDAALEPLAAQFGLAILKTAGGSIDAGNGSAMLKLQVVTEGGLTKEGATYNMMREHHDLPPLGTTFTAGGSGQHTITGMNTTGTKVYAKRTSDGKTYIWNTAVIARVCKAAAAKAAA